LKRGESKEYISPQSVVPSSLRPIYLNTFLTFSPLQYLFLPGRSNTNTPLVNLKEKTRKSDRDKGQKFQTTRPAKKSGKNLFTEIYHGDLTRNIQRNTI
jgi:hypothetical protein